MLASLTARLRAQLDRWTRDEDGQTMVEYVMLIVLVALAVFLLSPNLKDGVIKVFQNTSSAVA